MVTVVVTFSQTKLRIGAAEGRDWRVRSVTLLRISIEARKNARVQSPLALSTLRGRAKLLG
jgi:hypothetical protein